MTTNGSSELSVKILPAFSDNYIYVIHWDGEAVVVDPGDADPVMFLLRDNNWHLQSVLCTHYHDDHIGGVPFLKRQTNCQVMGPSDSRIGGLDRVLEDGETVAIDPLNFQVISVPGHTSIHVAYYFPKEKWLFSGDSLFAGGCGRLFEGAPELMWESLCKLRALPDDVQVYCGHEYTEANLKFAHSIEPENKEVEQRLAAVSALRHSGKATVPSTLGEEKRTNPFLRADSAELKATLNMSKATDVEVFAETRHRKDLF